MLKEITKLKPVIRILKLYRFHYIHETINTYHIYSVSGILYTEKNNQMELFIIIERSNGNNTYIVIPLYSREQGIEDKRNPPLEE